MTFLKWFGKGYTDLLPVIPPGAELSPLSKIPAEALGKVPGRRKMNGQWSGFPEWLTHRTTANDCRLWEKWYDGTPSIGLRSERFPAIDIDVTDETAAELCEVAAERVFGATWARWREGTSKRLLMYRTPAPFRRMRLWFRLNGERHLVEVLGSGNHFLVSGQHKSGGEYHWERPTAAPASIPSAEVAAEYLNTVAAALEKLGADDLRFEGLTRAVARAENVEQDHLRGDYDAVAALVARIPNTDDLFPTRDDYLTMGYAIKAAVGEEGLPLWQEWGSRWVNADGGENYPDVMAADWSRMQPPFSVGYPWLVDMARKTGLSTAEEDFEPLEDAPPAPKPEPDLDEDADTAESEPGVPSSGAIPYSDAWVAARFLHEYGGRIRHCAHMGGWMVWDGSKWALDVTNQIPGWAAKTCRAAGRHAIHKESNPAKAEAYARACASDRMRRSVLSYASTDSKVNVLVSAFDADPWLLNTPGGYMDLRTGKLYPPDPEKLFTRCTAVAPKAGPAPRWAQFLDEVTDGDKELQAYLARLAGYALTGSTREHAMAFLWGSGGNGKGVFLNTLVRLYGSYAAVAAMDTFTASRNDRHPAELASLMGARMVTAQETQEGRSWDEAKIKSITGGDPISARFMRQDFFTYQPQFTLLFAGNHRPQIKGLDDAMRRRIHLVPFNHKPAKPNPALADEILPAEWPQILAWAVAGASAWLQEGLNPPAVVLEATSDYFDDQDAIGRWMDDRTEVAGGGQGTETRTLFGDWRRWCHEQNEPPGTEKDFSAALAARGFGRYTAAGNRMTEGLLIRADLPPVRNAAVMLA